LFICSASSAQLLFLSQLLVAILRLFHPESNDNCIVPLKVLRFPSRT